MDYEDRLLVWCVAVREGIAYWNGRGLLTDVDRALVKLNAHPRLSDVGQLRAVPLKRIVAEFKDRPPPYSSFDPRIEVRTERRQDQAAERAAKHRTYMREQMRVKRSERLANLTPILRSQSHSYLTTRDLGQSC